MGEATSRQKTNAEVRMSAKVEALVGDEEIRCV